MKERTAMDFIPLGLYPLITSSLTAYCLKDTGLTDNVKVVTGMLAGLAVYGLEHFIDGYTRSEVHIGITAKQLCNIQRREKIANTLDNILHPWKPIYNMVKETVNKTRSGFYIDDEL